MATMYVCFLYENSIVSKAMPLERIALSFLVPEGARYAVAWADCEAESYAAGSTVDTRSSGIEKMEPLRLRVFPRVQPGVSRIYGKLAA